MLDQLAEAQSTTPVVCVQNRYALDSRTDDADDVLKPTLHRGPHVLAIPATSGPSSRSASAPAGKLVARSTPIPPPQPGRARG